jgi:hypothetical protein
MKLYFTDKDIYIYIYIITLYNPQMNALHFHIAQALVGAMILDPDRSLTTVRQHA